MPNYNKAILMGRLTRDPDFRIMPSGHPRTVTAIAVNHDWVDQQTRAKSSTVCFIDIEASGRNAEVLNQCYEKGSPIYVEGRLRYWTWKNRNGDLRSKHDLIVESLYDA